MSSPDNHHSTNQFSQVSWNYTLSVISDSGLQMSPIMLKTYNTVITRKIQTTNSHVHVFPVARCLSFIFRVFSET